MQEAIQTITFLLTAIAGKDKQIAQLQEQLTQKPQVESKNAANKTA